MNGVMNSRRLWARRPWASVAAAALAAAAGCGDTKGLVPVEGRVTFAGKRPDGPGYLYFVPRELSTNLRQDRAGPLPGTALFLADGQFRAGTFIAGDGLRPGSYEVRIVRSAKDTGNARHAHDDVPESSPMPAGFVPPDLVVSPQMAPPIRYDLDVK